MLIIAFAGLPGTGKTTLANLVAERLKARVFSKDRIRSELFAPEKIEYSRAQDDYCMGLLYQSAQEQLTKQPLVPVIIDGRTFSRHDQVRSLQVFADQTGAILHLIECTCSEESAKSRLERDQLEQSHQASNRDFALYQCVREHADPIRMPRLVIQTDLCSLEEAVARVLEYCELN